MSSEVIRLNKETVQALEAFRRHLCATSTVEPSVYLDMSYSKLVRVAILYADVFIQPKK